MQTKNIAYKIVGHEDEKGIMPATQVMYYKSNKNGWIVWDNNMYVRHKTHRKQRGFRAFLELKNAQDCEFCGVRYKIEFKKKIKVIDPTFRGEIEVKSFRFLEAIGD